MDKIEIKNKIYSITSKSLKILAAIIVAYIFILPFYPAFKMNIIGGLAEENWLEVERVEERVVEIKNHLVSADYTVSPNRLIIPKIGVNAPIVESNSEDYGLSRGAWRMPKSSTPDEGGNTVITGHRFKYLPPNNLTFYLFHKLEVGDIFSSIWEDEIYYYKIREIKIVKSTDLSILNESDESIMTLFTCDPIYSTENRLVVIGELITEENN